MRAGTMSTKNFLINASVIVSFENSQFDVKYCMIRVGNVGKADYDVHEYQLHVY